MFLFIDNYDSFSWNLVQAFYALGRKPVVHANDDPRILELAASPELEAVCISPGPSHAIVCTTRVLIFYIFSSSNLLSISFLVPLNKFIISLHIF